MIYRALRFLFGVAVRTFFRRIEVEGIENVPDSGPVLLLPNHPNALVDALVILMHLKRPVSLTAKSTLANHFLLRIFIRRTRVILLHRKQDAPLGADRSRNVAALEECRKRLAKGAAICLFPEGQSHSDPSLRPFRWGAARMALQYQASGPGPLPSLTIVPVGLNFLGKDRFRSDVWLRFGSPIDVAEWVREHPEGTESDLTAVIEEGVRGLTLNFNRRRDSLLMDWAAEILGTGGLPPPPLGREPSEVSDHLLLVRLIRDGYEDLKTSRRGEVEELTRRVRQYRKELKGLGMAPREVYILMTPGLALRFVLREAAILSLGFPLAVYGALNHLVPALIVRSIARKLSLEKDQWASNTVFPAVVLFPLFYSLQTVAVGMAVSPLVAAAYAALLPLSGYAAIRFAERAGSAWVRSRTFVRFVTHPGLQARLAEEGREIIDDMRRLGEEREKGST